MKYKAATEVSYIRYKKEENFFKIREGVTPINIDDLVHVQYGLNKQGENRHLRYMTLVRVPK